jgi:hypothetical protein
MQTLASEYSQLVAVTPSDTTLLNCRALVVAVGGTLVLTTAIGVSAVTLTAIAGMIYPIQLNAGLVGAASTATGIVALT